MIRLNPLNVTKIFPDKRSRTLYSRVDNLMSTETGLIGVAWSNLREAWFGSTSKQLLIVSYEGLTHDPDKALKKLYASLGEPFFQHDFDNIDYAEPEYDADLGMPGLHTVRSKVAFEQRTPVVPPDIFSKFADSAFWRGPIAHDPGPTIIC